ncbi:MAG: DUF418 domain-containing protein, partial [Caldimonas sp.]
AAFDYEDLEASNNLAFGTGSFVDAARETARTLAWGYGTAMGRWSYALFYVHMATGMLLGYAIGRRGWIRRLDGLRPEVQRLQWITLGVGIAGALVYAVTRPGALIAEPAPLLVFGGAFMHAANRLALMIFYALTLVRITALPAWRRVLLPFAAAGRMPLTNYLLQTVLGTFIFYGWGLGYWGRVGPASELLLAPLLFVAIQLPLSVWWLRRHRYGPLEYAWRVLAYGRSIT